MKRKVRVLVAEDDEDHIFFITRALHRYDRVEFEVEAVRDGEEALAVLYRRGPYTDHLRPHLVLLDLRMPRSPGWRCSTGSRGIRSSAASRSPC